VKSWTTAGRPPMVYSGKNAFRSVKDPEEKGIFCLLMNLKGW